MNNIILSIIIFGIVFFLYLHIYYHFKINNDLEILTIDGFVLKLDDKIKDNTLKLSKISGKKKKRLKSKLETEFRLIIHNYLDFYIHNTTETRDVAMNTIYTMIDSLAFR